ncbi:MAG: nucleotidyltransferase family protein [Cyanobium sp.]
MNPPLDQAQLEAITTACRSHHVARLHAFGSVLRSDYRPGESDIDLLVEFQDLEPAQLARAYFALEEQLSQSIGGTVDLVMATALRNPIVHAEVESSKQLIYAA